METFNIIYPSPVLAPYIRYYWLLKVDTISEISETSIPVGCINLIFHRGSRMFSETSKELQPQSFIGGLSTEFTELTSTGNVDMIVVVFQPFGARAFFALPMSEFFNSCISVNDIGDISLKELANQIQDNTDSLSSIALIEKHFIKQLHSFDDHNYKRIVTAIEAVNNQPLININSLSDMTCLSNKQFTRIFTEYVGAKPKEFTRIIRFQRALYILQTNPQISLTQLAFECGYYDQPHLIKEFKTFSGCTPTEFMANCPPYSDYFSTL
ncbi:AraC-like DNA-binding protein [Dysgonomonas alginatilytica]|uniref:AraC-like DNA-binding protein n=1 Tax=Dysgonomonas alginatilytica TaxID=1605892 RepID=A0A2V3PVB1_9BACT|nr:helix-turn-helix domain-containing protein [Dysgonomonas alginatilytica]PXV63584.1 AraC-like DNA-binding protein [Dysgonomonas alginatilytica]